MIDEPQQVSDYDRGYQDALLDISERLADVTRVTIVHRDRGRDYEAWDFHGTDLAFQDDNRTLKIIDHTPKEET